MKLLDTKAGKRVRRSMVDLLRDAIDSMKAVLVWAEYSDSDVDVEEGEKAPFPRRATVGDIERSRSQLRPSRGGGGTANWSARVGEIIIGNLMRGEGGRFASARNIGKMMRALDDVGITPDMFVGMQNLLAGNSAGVSGSVMANLRSAGLVNDAGVVQAKANEIINAIKTGDPKNLTKVLKPPSGSSGGGGGSGSSGPSKEERWAENVDKVAEEITSRTGIGREVLDALIAFFDGEDIPEEFIQTLLDEGLIARNDDGDIYLTSFGKSLVTNMRAGDLRDCLDAIAKARQSVKDDADEETDDTETAENVEAVTQTLVERGGVTREQIETLINFDNDEDVSDEALADLIDLGLVNVDSRGEFYMMSRGQQLILRLRDGNKRDALDTLSRSREEARDRVANAKATRASTAEKLISSGNLTRAQADAMIRLWVGDTDISEEALAQLQQMGLAIGNSLTPYGKLFMRALDMGNTTLALEVLADAGPENKMVGGMKGLGGNWFLTWTTNAFVDREDEIFSTKSIEEYLKETDEKGVNGSYDFWHIEGSEFATIKWQGGVGRFMVEIGKFDDTPMGHAFKAFFNRYPDTHPKLAPYGWGCSHKYVYEPSDRSDGVYDWFYKQKTTVLPLQEAANVFTLAEFGLGEKNMKLSDKQRDGLATIASEVGIPDLVSKIEEIGEQRTSALELEGIQYKSKKDEVGEELMDRHEISLKMSELAGLVPEEVKADFEQMAEKVDEPESDVAAIHRMLMELVVELPEETRMQAEELISALADLAEPVLEEEMVEEEIVEEEVPEEEVVEEEVPEEELEVEEAAVDEEMVVTSDGEEEEMKNLSNQIARTVAESLHLEELSELLQAHGLGIKSQSDAISEMVEKFKGLVERVDVLEGSAQNTQELEKEVKEVKETVATVQEQAESEASEKAFRFTPYWVNGVSRGGVARETELTGSERKELRTPKVPSTIVGIRKTILNK